MLNFIADIVIGIVIGFKEGITDLINWNKPEREAPTHNKNYLGDTKWRRYLSTEITALIVSVLILLVVIRQGVGEFRFIPSESMEPTLLIGDRLFVEKFTPNFKKEYQRGDVVIFYPPIKANAGRDVLNNSFWNHFTRLVGLPFLNPPEAYIKRVIGLPGETIKIVQDQGVYINGQLLDEPYHFNTQDEYLPNYTMPEVEIPANSYYVLGDNRNNSHDSHRWGALPVKRIIGKASFILWRHGPTYKALDQKPIMVPEA